MEAAFSACLPRRQSGGATTKHRLRARNAEASAVRSAEFTRRTKPNLEVLVAVFNGMFPVLPGQDDAARAFASEVSGQRRDGFKAQQAKASITRELWTLQQTPVGSALLVWFEGDVEKAFADLATDTNEFAVWFRAQVKSVSGVDLSAPPDGPAPEPILDWTA